MNRFRPSERAGIEQDSSRSMWIPVRKISKIIFEKRAVNNVISAVILTGAVIALSLAVFGWAQGRSSDYNSEFGETVDAETARLKEKLVFECVFYEDDALTVYLLNCGTIDEVMIKAVYIYDSSNTLIDVFSKPPLYSFQGWDVIPGQVLDRGDEGRLFLELESSLSGFCTIRVVTERGAPFDSGFVA